MRANYDQLCVRSGYFSELLLRNVGYIRKLNNSWNKSITVSGLMKENEYSINISFSTEISTVLFINCKLINISKLMELIVHWVAGWDWWQLCLSWKMKIFKFLKGILLPLCNVSNLGNELGRSHFWRCLLLSQDLRQQISSLWLGQDLAWCQEGCYEKAV